MFALSLCVIVSSCISFGQYQLVCNAYLSGPLQTNPTCTVQADPGTASKTWKCIYNIHGVTKLLVFPGLHTDRVKPVTVKRKPPVTRRNKSKNIEIKDRRFYFRFIFCILSTFWSLFFNFKMKPQELTQNVFYAFFVRNKGAGCSVRGCLQTVTDEEKNSFPETKSKKAFSNTLT